MLQTGGKTPPGETECQTQHHKSRQLSAVGERRVAAQNGGKFSQTQQRGGFAGQACRQQSREQRLIGHCPGNQDFQGEKHGGQGRLEQTGKAGGHTGNQQHPLFGRSTEFPPQAMGQRSADLHGHTLPSGAAAEQMGQPSADHHQRNQGQGNGVPPILPGLKHQGHALLT